MCLTGRQRNLSGYPTQPDGTPPGPGFLHATEQQACLTQPTSADRVRGKAQQCVRPGTIGVDPVRIRIAPTSGQNTRECQAVEWTSQLMRPQLAVVGGTGGQGKRGDHRVGVVTERIQHGGRGGVVPLPAEHDGGEPPQP